MKMGDRITQFMRQLAMGDRIFVILSEKYLCKSEYCMYELHQIWQNCRFDEDRFLRRVKVFKLPCAKISSVTDRLKISLHWQQQKQEIEELFRQLKPGALSEREFHRIRSICQFADHISDMLELIEDVLKPQSFEQLLEEGFQ